MLLHDFLLNSAEWNPDKIALVNQGRRVTYRQLNEHAARLANGLIAHGFARGDRAAVYLENSVESVISIFGILKAGGVFLVINPQVKSKKLSYVLNDCQVKVLITDPTGAPQVLDGMVKCPSLGLLLLSSYELMKPPEPGSADDAVRQDATVLPVVERIADIVDDYSTEEPRCACIDMDLASLTYTSGSTGDPKGVMLTHLNMVTAVSSITRYLENRADDIILSHLPLSFDYGLYQVLMAMKFGGTVVLEKSFVYPFQAVQAILSERITGLPLVPAMAALILELNDLDKYDFSCVRYITNTGQALPPAHSAELRRIFKRAGIFSMYGLTECKRVSYLPPSEIDKRPLSVGKAIPNTETWLIDEQGDRVTEPWAIGELVIRGSHVMKGYWNKPAETEAVLKAGRFPGERVLLSGDFFKMDEDGFLYFVARKDDVFKSGGERISPREIEDVLYEMEGVSEAAVIGVPDRILGNAIKAFVVFREGMLRTEAQILRFCGERLERSRVPKFVEIRKSLPKSSSGKIRKKDLQEELRE